MLLNKYSRMKIFVFTQEASYVVTKIFILAYFLGACYNKGKLVFLNSTQKSAYFDTGTHYLRPYIVEIFLVLELYSA
jgi:hypothetical protein